ncbi:MAG: hypothetical protein OEX83_10325 [Gammaproteobacteria bacterium]|nr:hypothetical protein [Gammaproteobacteria bacterium]
MKDKLEQLIKRIDAFNKRERMMLLGASIICLYMIWDSVLLHPLQEEKTSYDNTIISLNKQISDIELQVNNIIQQSQIDPDNANKTTLEKLKQDIATFDKKLNDATLGLISPRQMPGVLEDVMGKSKNIKLVRMDSIPAVSMMKQLGVESAEPVTESVSAGIFRHGLLLEVEGSYLDTLALLKELEKLEWKLYWDSIEFKTETYPNAKVLIKVYTLSLDKGWIGV